MDNYKLIINNDIDLIEKLYFNQNTLQNFTESKKEGLKAENFSIECYNHNNFFNFLYDKSIFYNTNIKKFDLSLYMNDRLLWKSYLNNIKIDESKKTATLELETEISKTLNQTCFSILENKNPIEIILDQLEKLGLSSYIDYVGFNRAIDFFNSVEYFVRLSSYIEPSQNTTVFDFIETIINLLTCNIYITNNYISFSHYDPNEIFLIGYQIFDESIISIDEIYTDYDSIINDYRIQTNIGECRDIDNLNLGAISRFKYGNKEYSTNCTDNDYLVITEASVGYTLGNLKILKNIEPKTYIKLTVDKAITKDLKLTDIIGLNIEKFNIINDKYEVVEITRTTKINEPEQILLMRVDNG